MGLVSSAQHRQGDGPTSSHGPVSMAEQRAACSGGLVIEVVAAVLLKLGLSPSRVGGVGGLASSAQHHRGDGPTSSLGPVNMGKEQRAVCDGGLVVTVEVAVLSEVWFGGGGGGGDRLAQAPPQRVLSQSLISTFQTNPLSMTVPQCLRLRLRMFYSIRYRRILAYL